MVEGKKVTKQKSSDSDYQNEKKSSVDNRSSAEPLNSKKDKDKKKDKMGSKKQTSLDPKLSRTKSIRPQNQAGAIALADNIDETIIPPLEAWFAEVFYASKCWL